MKLPSFKSFLQTEATTTRKPVSESLVQALGATVNFSLDTSIYTVEWKLNGPIKFFNGKTFVDGIFTFPATYNWEIFDAAVYAGIEGSGGLTTLSVDVAVFGSTTWNSIFTSNPSIGPSAGAGASAHVGDVVTGISPFSLTANPLPVTPKSKLRLEVLAVQSGQPQNFGMRVFYRARN